jgi:hypothetical protein
LAIFADTMTNLLVCTRCWRVRAVEMGGIELGSSVRPITT